MKLESDESHVRLGTLRIPWIELLLLLAVFRYNEMLFQYAFANTANEVTFHDNRVVSDSVSLFRRLPNSKCNSVLNANSFEQLQTTNFVHIIEYVIHR